MNGGSSTCRWDEITGAARNPKKTDDAGIRRSIERFGFATPALRDEHTGPRITHSDLGATGLTSDIVHTLSAARPGHAS
jgi:hypothetical protein